MADEVIKDFANQVVEQALTKALENAGISLDYSAQKVKELMEIAENKVHYDQTLCEWKISPPLAALNIQIKATDMALKLLGAYPSEKHDVRHSVAPDLEQRLRRAHNGEADESESDEDTLHQLRS